MSDDVIYQFGINPGYSLQWRKHITAFSFGVRLSLLVVHGHPTSDSGNHTNHLLSGDLLWAANTPNTAALIADEGLQG